MSLRLADFAGGWVLSRVIDDRRAGHAARFEGRAEFRPDAQGLICEEVGTLHLPGAAPIRATRRYLWRAEGGAIAVLFADGRAFHRFVPGAACCAAHWCDPDQYRVAYDFARWPEWSARWEVRGPRKDYSLRSSYRRG